MKLLHEKKKYIIFEGGFSIIILPIQVYRQRVVKSPSQFIDDLTVLWQQLFRTTTTNCFRS